MVIRYFPPAKPKEYFWCELPYWPSGLKLLDVSRASRVLTQRNLSPIMQGLRAGADRALLSLGPQNVNVRVFIDKKGVLASGRAIGGFVCGSKDVLVGVNPKHIPSRAYQNFSPEQILYWQAASALAHELHHTKRIASGSGYRNLGEALVTEGLAVAFEYEAGFRLSINPGSISPDSLEKLAFRANQSLAAKKYDHASWFIENNKKEIPSYAGYILGYTIVNEWLAAHNKKAFEEAHVKASVVLRWSEQNGILRTPNLPALGKSGSTITPAL